jgi:aarF domain-containing kinase
MYPAPSWRRRPAREPDYARRQPLPADAPALPVASHSTPLPGATLYGGNEGRFAPENEDNDPHDLAAFSLSDPLDFAQRRAPVEDNDPHDLMAATRWSFGDPTDHEMLARKKYTPPPFKPVFIAGEDNDPHDLSAATRWSLSDPLDLEAEAPRLRRVNDEDNDPHDMSAFTPWSLSDPLDTDPSRFKYLQSRLGKAEDNDPHDLMASTRWSFGDPTDHEMLARKRAKYTPPEFKPVYVGANAPTTDLHAWSMSDPLDRPGPSYKPKSPAKTQAQLERAAAEDNDPHDLMAATRWSFGDPTDHEMLARKKKYSPPEFKPVFVGGEAKRGPQELTASTKFSLSDPLNTPRKVKTLPKEDNDPHDLMAATRWSFGDPTDHEMLARKKKYTPPEFKPVFVGGEAAGRSPHDLTAATKFSLSDPLDTARSVKTLQKEDNDPHDLMAGTKWSFGDPTDHEMLARKRMKYSPPEFKPVFVGSEQDAGRSPHDLTAATKFSMSDPLDYDRVRKTESTGGLPTPAATRPTSPVDTVDRAAEAVAAAKAAEPAPVAAATPPLSPASEAMDIDVEADPESFLPKINRDPDEERVALRSSTVPSSRIGRLFHYGSLGLSLGLGAATETIRRTAGGSGTGSVFMSDANVRRLVATLGRMRGAALKLGQFMSIQDNNMLPPEIERVLQQVQDHANYMPEWQMEKVMRTELGAEWESLFKAFDRVPVAAASIGQVHRAVLADGTPVAVKVQFPGVADSIESDLANVSLLLRGSAVLPPGLYLQNTMAVAKRELEDECDYVREGQAGARFHNLLAGDAVFDVPRVFEHATTGKVLTTEWMAGRPLSKMKGMSQEQRDLIGSSILRLCLQELFTFRFMQTDSNWANFLFDAPTGRIQLIDFGASREYTKEFMDGWYRLLQAALDGDRPAMKAESESLGYLTGEENELMVNAHLDSMAALASPFQHEGKFEFATQTITDKVRALIPVMLQHRLTPPPAPTYSLNRKLSGAFLMCSKLGANVDCKALWEGVTAGYKVGPEVSASA